MRPLKPSHLTREDIFVKEKYICILAATQEDKLASLHKEAERIVKSEEIPSVSSANQKRTCQFARFFLDGDVIDPFKDYFTLSSHQMNTRNNAKMILLPKVRTECGRKRFHFISRKLFNMLPLQGRSLSGANLLDFINNYYYYLQIPVGFT